jgi:hypothetical protein
MEPAFDLAVIRLKRPEALESDAGCTHAFRRFLFVHPALFCLADDRPLDLGYNTGEFGKNHLGDHTAALPTAHGFQEYWGYLYHLDAMQQVSFPDINKDPTTQTVAPPCKNTPIPGVPEVPGAVDPKTTICLTPPGPPTLKS